MRPFALVLLFVITAVICRPGAAQSVMEWAVEFPRTDFGQSTVPLREITFDGARRDSIPPIHRPRFARAAAVTYLGDLEPVISVIVNDDARAYPLRILLWHEIVNDVVGGVPTLISYCPLCNSGVVFDRRLDGLVLDFGNTGRIRHFDMVMYDHQTESWWQQFSGAAIVGELAGESMAIIPSRLESLGRFRTRAPDGIVLVPNDPSMRPYGQTPYVGMDSRAPPPGAFDYPLPDALTPLDYVVVAGDRAWPLERLMRERRIEEQGVVLTWVPGRNSIHDTRQIDTCRDLGSVMVTSSDQPESEVAHDTVFAFAFSAFVPDGRWMLAAE